MALFAGSAAQSTNDSLLQWRQLWQQQDQANKNYELAQQQMSFQAQQQLDSQAFQERMAKAQEAFQLGVLDRNELFEISKLTIDMMPNMSLESQWAQVEALQEMGSPLTHVARGNVRAGLFDNFQDAVSLVDSVFTAPIGTPFNAAFVGLAADAVIARSGLEGEAAENFRADLEAALEARQGDAERWEGMQWGNAQTALDQARANVVQTRTETKNIDAQTQSIFQGMQFDAEKHGFIIDSLDLQNQLLSSEVAISQIREGNLPAQFAAELRNLNAQTRGLENGNELFKRTVDLQVEQLSTELDISREQLRHDLATGMARDAIVQGDLDYLRATIDYVGQQELESAARTEGLHVSADAAKLDMTNTRVSIITSLVEMGRGDLLGQVAPDLLAGLDIPEDAQGELLASLTETANSRLTAAEKIEKANVQVALAEARYATWNANTIGERTAADAARADRALDLQAEGLAIERTRVGAYANSLNSPAGASSVPISDVHNAVKNGIGISVGDLTTNTEDYNGWVQADEELLNFGEIGEDGSFTVTDPTGVEALGAQYGLDPMLSADEMANTLRSMFAIETRTTRARAEADTLAYIRAFMEESGGRIPNAGELGFETGDPIFVAAMNRVPGMTLLDEAATGVGLDLENIASELSPTIGEDGILFGGAAAVYEALVEQHGIPAMEAAGFFDASSLIPTLQRHSIEYQGYYSQAQAGAEALGSITGQTWDLTSTADRANLEQTLASYDSTAGTFLTMLDELPNRGLFPNANATMRENDFIHALSRTLNVPLGSMIERGLVNQAGVVDRAAVRQLLLGFQGQLNEQRLAVQHIDGLLRTR